MKKNKLHIIVLISIFCQTVFSSCQFEALETGLFSESMKLLVDSEPIETRSASSDGMELNRTIVMGEDSLLLQEFVCENLSLPFDEVAETRSAVVTTAGLQAAAKFGIQCFVDNYNDIDCADDVKPVLTGDDQYIADGTVEYKSSDWGFTDGSGTAVDYKWLNKIYHTFWSLYPKTNFPTSTFGLSSSGIGKHKMTISDFVAPYDYASQKDLLVAYNNQYFDETNGGNTISIKFKHILSQIYFEFDATSITGAGYTVTQIQIVGAIGKGTCVIDAEATPMITWTPNTSVTGTFTMAPGADASLNNFFMIPQTLPADAKIKITMTKGSETISREKSLNTTTWKPGYYYKYKLTYEPATYDFKLSTTGAATQTFTDKNTTGSKTKYVSITSTKKKGTAAAEQWEWDIQSYQIGSGSEVPVESSASSFTAEDLIVTEDRANKRLILESKKWEGIDKGGHDYWTNKNGISGDNSGNGWSPKDWSGTYTSSNPLDLSKFDFQNETNTSMNTANCYIVRHAGTYMIPLVYGNGVKNGSAYSGAYTFSGGLTTFLNHKGNGISSPFIENNTSCTAGSATIEWQDRQESGLSPVIQDVSLVGSTATTYTASNVRYIQFTVSPGNIRQTNAVIAVKDGSSNIMWSWHIWVTNDPAVLSGPISVSNYTNNTYGFFPSSSLGWIDPKTYEDREDITIKLVQKSSGNTLTVTVKQTKPDRIASSGVMYQWGRKDPFPTDNVTLTQASGTASLATAIKNPKTFYASGTTNNWFSTAYTNLWAGKYSGYFSSSISKASDLTSKTIYDPSPVGYKVPSIFAYTGFSTTGNDPATGIASTTASPTGYNVPSGTKFDKGWNFNTRVGSGTIFFDASGWSTNGTINSKGVEGNYHSALLYSSANNHIVYWAWGLDGANLYMKLTNTTGARLGASVRPVTE